MENAYDENYLGSGDLSDWQRDKNNEKYLGKYAPYDGYPEEGQIRKAKRFSGIIVSSKLFNMKIEEDKIR
jgi:hypothetical protein